MIPGPAEILCPPLGVRLEAAGGQDYRLGGDFGEVALFLHQHAGNAARLILQQFVGNGIPWAHLDIAGPAFTDAEDGEWSKGGTGFGVRLLADLATNFQKPAA